MYGIGIMLFLSRTMKVAFKIPWLDLLTAIVLYSTILIYQGYQYGQSDQSQILPCLYAQDHPGTYADDHYVSRYLKADINERTVFHFLFRHLGYDLPWIVFIWHLLISTALILAWLKITSLGIRHKGYQYLAVVSIFIIGYHTSVGSNELYYNMVIPSLAAKAFGSWALYFWLKQKYTEWIVLIAIAGFLQPLVGVQLFILTFASTIIHSLLHRKTKEIPWKMLSLYFLVTIPWIHLLGKHNGGMIQPVLFMDIMEFRLSHHFFPSSFGILHLIVFSIMCLVTILFYRQRLKWFMLIILLGCIVYTIGVDVYRHPIVLYTQWWKTTIWMEAFLLVAIAVTLEKNWPNPRIFTKYTMLFPIGLLLLIGVYRLSGWFGEKPEYMVPWSSAKSDQVDVSEKARELTKEDAVFIIPVNVTAFRWYSKRSQYVDYKALFHQEFFLQEWYQRIGNIYAYGQKERQGGFDINVFSKALLEEPSLISTDYWRKLGITHIISTSPEVISLKKVYSNSTYSIYSLQ